MNHPQFDPSLIERYADQLYRKADSVRVGSAVVGAILGAVFGAAPVSPVGEFLPVPSAFGAATVLLGGLVGGFLGYVVGEGRAFRIRLQAQMVLFQLQLERNTAHAAVAPPQAVAPAEASPAAATAPALTPAPVAAFPSPRPVAPSTAPVVQQAPLIPVLPARPAVAAAALASPLPVVPAVPPVAALLPQTLPKPAVSQPFAEPVAPARVASRPPLGIVPPRDAGRLSDDLAPPLYPPLSPG